ncbi:FtsK/SpoIIIE family protein, putative secretion system component EssC/YukA [Streptococcus cristatus]|uniref:FtsK/SpoIIIE family protein, putative secretion system component EssC/YukA n=1 Tax=Streptococcus cristatus TaxID=45634 RepID=A0A139N5K4_STRCR|nr:FtsK/SpoIIIE family protein, putative secretion system component EssC/YukA [Streptococcus cristatus]
MVDDQIWSNSRFKIALKVADRTDSNEMLHTPDAAEITQTGRAYLQVGNNEVYELFQSAWSGADYQPDKDDMGIEDHTIYLINELGQYEILNEDLSGLEEADEIKEVPTELDAIVQNIKLLTESQRIAPVPQPWLPPLPDKIILNELYETLPQWQDNKRPLEVILGKVDLPSKQSQQTATHVYHLDGHLALFSSPGMGKTTFLQSIGIDLARRNTPEQLHIYLLDFGTNGLLPLLGLPQVADIIYPDDEEKIPKFVTKISEEIRRRKTLFADYRVASLETYEKASGDVLPSMMFIIDSYEGLKGSKYEDLLEKMVTTISRDGTGLGMYLTLSTGRLGTLKAALHTNIRTKITFKQTDETESKGIVGRYTVPMEEKVGRGMLKLEEPEVFQAPIPVDGQDAFDINEHLKEEVKQLDKRWTGSRPGRIPVVPDVLTVDNFLGMPEVKTSIQNGELPIGLEFEEVKAISIPIQQLNGTYII